MGETIVNRTIRPSTRQEGSPYRVNVESVSSTDTLIVNINHESKPFKKTYTFKGTDVAHKKSIHFKAIDNGTSINIRWNGVIPMDSLSNSNQTATNKDANRMVQPGKVSSRLGLVLIVIIIILSVAIWRFLTH